MTVRANAFMRILALLTVLWTVSCSAGRSGPTVEGAMDHGMNNMHTEAQRDHAVSSGADHAGHKMETAVTDGSWSYTSRTNPKPFTEKRWEMVPVPEYGHLYVNTGKLSQDHVCGALRDNPRIMVDRATRKTCGMPEMPTTGVEQMPPMRREQEEERPPHREHGAMHEHWTAPLEAAKRKNPVSADAASTERGGKLFEKHCVVCHGPEGRGDGPAGAALKPKPSNLDEMAGQHPEGDLAWKIENGRGAMPAWKGTLNESQIWDIVNFLKSLAKVTSELISGPHEPGRARCQMLYDGTVGKAATT